jgi:hypothetical protein
MRHRVATLCRVPRGRTLPVRAVPAHAL